MADQQSGLINKTLTTGDASPQMVAKVPECEYASMTVIIVNNGTEEAAVTLYLAADETEANPIDLVDYQVTIPAGGRYIYGCAVVSQGECFFVQTSAKDLPVRVEGVLSI